MEKALSAMTAMGFPSEDVLPFLRKLLKMYDNDSSLLEENNYSALFDAYDEHMNDKKTEIKRDSEEHGGISQKPAKRRHMTTKGEHISRKIVGSNKDSASKDIEVWREKPKPSQPHSKDIILANRYQVPRSQTVFEGGGSSSSVISSQTKKSKSLRDIPQALCTNPVVQRSCSSDIHRVNSTSRPHKDGSPKTSSKRSVRDLSVSCRPLSVSNPDLICRTSSSEYRNTLPVAVNEKRNLVADITRGTEKIKIPLVGVAGKENLPKFMYMRDNRVYQDGKINISLARIGDDSCCFNCLGDCLSSIPCACAGETGGKFAYTSNGLLEDKFLSDLLSMKIEPQEKDMFYCKNKDCPVEKAKDEYLTEECKGHLIRKFIKECWIKCGCDMSCGNRVVQRGISCKMEVFLCSEKKGWGVRTLEPLRKGTFVCEYVGEILTNNELFNRNLEVSKERHTYPVTLDGDWGSEEHMKDEDALCLDATFFGNVARFINHRCHDANLIDVPVEIETQDRHYYHLAFFTTKDVAALEELTWDYGIDFDDTTHPIKAFRCSCGSKVCRDNRSKRKKEKNTHDCK